jgi:hypothetical protein
VLAALLATGANQANAKAAATATAEQRVLRAARACALDVENRAVKK